MSAQWYSAEHTKYDLIFAIHNNIFGVYFVVSVKTSPDNLCQHVDVNLLQMMQRHFHQHVTAECKVAGK